MTNTFHVPSKCPYERICVSVYVCLRQEYFTLALVLCLCWLDPFLTVSLYVVLWMDGWLTGWLVVCIGNQGKLNEGNDLNALTQATFF